MISKHRHVVNKDDILVVAGSVSSAASLVLQVTILEGQSQDTSQLARRQLTLRLVGDIDSGDLERSRDGRPASSRR